MNSIERIDLPDGRVGWQQGPEGCPVFRRNGDHAELCTLPAGHEHGHTLFAHMVDDIYVRPRRVLPGESYRIGDGQSVLEVTGGERTRIGDPDTGPSVTYIAPPRTDPQPDEKVEHPSHYGGDTAYEVIKVCEAWGLDQDAYLFQAVKYIARAGKKPGEDAAVDLSKARFYIDRRIALLRGESFIDPRPARITTPDLSEGAA